MREHIKHRHIVYAATSAILLACGGIWARPTTPDEAQAAVLGWLKTDPQPLGAVLGRRVLEVRTYAGDDGRPAYHIVYLQPSGFVIVSADDRVEPVIGFADDGLYEASIDNPMGALVTNDLNRRVTATADRFGVPMPMRFNGASGPRDKWRHLIDFAENRTDGFGLMALSSPGDIRVIPLLQSRWGQSTACGEYCYNYYTPSYYPAGCLATAMAQVMRYYEYPTDPIGVQEFTVEVGDHPVEQKVYTLGGDGLGGPYNWSAMPLNPKAVCTTLTETQRQAIGALCYDAGIAVEMTYERSGSGAFLPDARYALVNTFLYGSAIIGYDPGGNVHPGLREMINPSLDAKSPVILAISDISDPNSGHAVVCDGYGYYSSTLYHHLNMGWQGVDDVWYNLPEIDGSQDSFNVIFGCIYNISTSGTGEIISGRVLAPDGTLIVNAKVFAEPGGRDPRPALTDDRGIYALSGLASNTTYRIKPEADGYVFASQSVKTGSSKNNFTRSGNRSDIDFYAQSVENPPTPALIYVRADAPWDPGPHDSAISDPDEDGTLKHPFDAIQEAIDTAISGDTVIVLQGTYGEDGNRDLDFRGKAITVRSEDPNNPSLVVINCAATAENPHRGFDFHRYEGPNSMLEGLTITGGYHERGGAIYCGDNARPTIVKCVFRDNSATLGGGMFNDCSPTITDCTFISNSADAGGGLYNDGDASDCKPILINCNFSNNTVSHNGGGMYNLGRGAAPTLTGCTFAENSVSAGGGGAIRNNLGGNVTLSNCLLINNSVATFGGAIRHSNGGTTRLRNCTLAANSALEGTAFASTPDDSGSQNSCVLDVLNCILWDGRDEISNDDKSTVNVTFSNIQGGSSRGPWPGQGNIDVDPHFADPDHGDYHLRSAAGRWDSVEQNWIFDAVTSPCIDAGDTSMHVGPEPPPNGGIINMGAYGGTSQASKSDSGL